MAEASGEGNSILLSRRDKLMLGMKIRYKSGLSIIDYMSFLVLLNRGVQRGADPSGNTFIIFPPSPEEGIKLLP